jgi:thiamine pyrophosphate-dependent acetolactate synthase large subunit-like protein
MATVREVTFDLLRHLGLTTVFGNPGSTEETFLQDFPEDIRYILGIHEDSVDDAADDAPLTARQLFRESRRASPPDTVLVEESPSNLAELHAEWPVSASGALGWDLPAAVGLTLAERDSGRNPAIPDLT